MKPDHERPRRSRGEAPPSQSRKRSQAALHDSSGPVAGIPNQVENLENDCQAESSMSSRPRALDYPKKRVLVACELCRSRKTRCDSARPTCSFCARLGIECFYRKSAYDKARPEVEPSADNASSSLADRLARIETLLLDANVNKRKYSTDELIESPPSESTYSRYQPVQMALSSASKHSSQNNVTHRSPDLASSDAAMPSARDDDRPGHFPMFGLNIPGLTGFAGHEPPAALSHMIFDDSESFIESEIVQGGLLCSRSDLTNLDLSPRTCWRLQQAFVKDVLPWFPVIYRPRLIEVVTQSCDDGFMQKDLVMALALFIFALGALARDNQDTSDSLSELPGFDYFTAAREIIDLEPGWRYTLISVQCRTLMALYLLFALRPLLAFNAASSAMNDILCLLHFRNDGHDEYFQEAIHRAYWTCFIILQELKLNVSFSTASLHYFRTVVPLPVSDHDEPGMFFFLSEVALRRICNSVQDSVFDINITYPPAVPDELITQLAQWYAGLPAAVSFPLDASVILDGHRAFLRAQYYSVLCVLHWSAVVRFLIQEPEDPRERERLLQSGARALEYAMLYISSSETLLLDRHVLLLANLNGLSGISLTLASAYNIPSISAIRPPGAAATIQKAYRMFGPWKSNPNVARTLSRLSVLMARGNIPEEPM